MANLKRTAGHSLHKSIALLLALCTLMLAAPVSLAASVGTTASAVKESTAMSFGKINANTIVFTTDTPPASGGVNITAGTWVMLVSNDTYTAGGAEYGCIWYNNTRYNILWSSVDVQTAANLETYVTGTLWRTSEYPSLKPEMNLKRDVRVYALQLALRTLGYYSDALDGSYGDQTIKGVRAFQRAYKLDVDGYAGPYTQKVLYPLAISAFSSSGSTSGTQTGSLKTKVSINLRKSYSTKSARLAVVPASNTLPYYKTVTTGGVVWYFVTYNNINGWLMGTYVNADGTGGGSGGSGSETVMGTVKANTNTVVRKAPNGSRTGYLLSKNSSASLLAAPVSAGGYNWYQVKLANGVKGYVRGDCVTANYDAGGGLTPSTAKTYIKVGSAGLSIFTTEEAPTSGTGTMVAANTVLQLVSTETYTKNNVQYCSLYYNNTRYNAKYSDVSAIIMDNAALTTYITGTIWPSGFTMAGTLKEELNLQGSVYVHSLQYALSLMGYYTGALDGNFGGATTTAVRNFQKAVKTKVDGSVGPETSALLYPKAITLVNGGSNGGGGGGTTVTDFGTFTKIKKAGWTFGDAGGDLFPKSATATVLDVQTGKVFRIKRWSGQYHADCVPLTEADTKIMADIIGFPYTSSRPTSAQLKQIIADDGTHYIWPDFAGSWTTLTWSRGAWDYRPALVNVNGTVYCVSVYGWPHGYSDVKNFNPSPSVTNYYGMMCLHFVGSWGHGTGAVSNNHQASINTAYSYAKSQWPSLVD
ncbi:MAG: peptidoglycan-binding domain-containing protein [Candidatus Limiplasma sp.]|nr:peptidoglycan-binding domain-containing protein [Candidatus Limiplasma sp.]